MRTAQNNQTSSSITMHYYRNERTGSLWKRSMRFLSFMAVFLLLVCIASWNLLVSHRTATELTERILHDQFMEGARSSKTKNRLRFDWSNLTPTSPLAHRLQRHQNNCSLPLANFKFRNRFGLGSDLHVWGQALCNSLHHKVRIRTVLDWLWVDQQECSLVASPMTCYFPNSELQCPGDVQLAKDHPTFDGAFFNISRGPRQGTVNWDCPSILLNYTQEYVQMAAMEWLFGQISPHIVREAERQHQLVFRGNNKTPDDLIAVHIRWGDKKLEMKLVTMKDYVRAIHQLLEERPRQAVNIYLATEDPEAVAQFQQQAPPNWNLYIDHFYEELSPHRLDEYNGVPKAATLLEGRMGTIALGSLLVAMEANEFVLTTESNWSRLMNELRQGILDPRCDNCTKLVDLKPAKNFL
jgi:hypothetical protein